MILAVVVSIFSLVAVIADLVRERKNAEQKVHSEPVDEKEGVSVSGELCVSADEEETSCDAAPRDENAIIFSAGEQKTSDEKFQELDEERQHYYAEIVQYAMGQPGAKRYKNARYEEYKIRKTLLVRLQIKRGVIICEFVLLNESFKNYIQDNKVKIRQAPAVLRVEDESSVAFVKKSIDIAVRAAADEQEYKKQRERRRLARGRKDEGESIE